ncbi:class I SAM-dependent methyltransferase [Saccharopolyspora rhizosphaerae]|uniref:Class I SAM-dependent methyltransferase n=1 Tax=Saccharopolyspora rhizosphaerae TaxID=2492662 RepID=A0A3R8P8U0_9PSEU|nr:class I SAM-dependent methyltransferase [Saccharopolyspora rhizosphaerae]RRO18886.1 class I SAM-dependent methyltransferase [Saccharopolyspora rhizosphaerae]
MNAELPDFDAVYRGESPVVDDTRVPWNIGEPQPAVAEVIARGDVVGPVLDSGCGVGVTSRELAARGFEVLGVDLSDTAIAQAEADRDERHATATFRVGDITEFAGYDGHFGTVIDCTLFHSLPVESRPGYLSAIARAARDGARLHMLVFDKSAFPQGGGPNAVDAEELRAAVGEHWRIDSIEPSTIAGFLPPSLGAHHPVDEQGRARVPAHFLTAHR